MFCRIHHWIHLGLMFSILEYCYWFNFFNRWSPIKIIYSFLQFWQTIWFFYSKSLFINNYKNCLQFCLFIHFCFVNLMSDCFLSFCLTLPLDYIFLNTKVIMLVQCCIKSHKRNDRRPKYMQIHTMFMD